jgi:ApbE superfamily uncharacterized protein (UPF0280 family)
MMNPQSKRQHRFELYFGQTHLDIASDIDCRHAALDELVSNYGQLINYINVNPLFMSSYSPVDVADDVPAIVSVMAEASSACNVGPMAAVAGSFAQVVGQRMKLEGASDVIVENGGDIYLALGTYATVAISAGPSALSERLALRVKPSETPCGICTSSSSVGPSISLGAADSVTVVATSSALADASATALGNMVKCSRDVKGALKFADRLPGITGVIIIIGDTMGLSGNLPELIKP